MPKVTGRVTDEAGVPQKGLQAELWYFQALFGLRRTDAVETNADGRFTLEFSFFRDVWLGFIQFDLHVRIKSKTDRLLFRSLFRDTTVLADDWPLGEVVIPKTTLGGWLVTNRHPTGQHDGLSKNNFVSVLVDNQSAWAELKLAVKASNTDICFLLFYFDIQQLFIAFAPGHPKEGEPTLGDRLEDLLLERNRRTPPVPTRLVLRWVPAPRTVIPPIPPEQQPIVVDEFHFVSRAKAAERFFRDHQLSNTVAVRPYRCEIRLPMHAKVAVFDGIEAHILGSPLLQEYYDSQEHRFDEPGRGEFVKFRNGIRVPIHDVGLRIQGPAAEHVRETVLLHWKATGGEDVTPIAPPPSSTPNASVQIVRTLPGERLGKPEGEIGILEAYLRVFEQAKDFIYLENQYFVDLTIMKAIVTALTDTARPNLQVIVCINSTVDLYPYNYYQGRRIPELQQGRVPRLIKTLQDSGVASRLGIFCLWVHEETSPKQLIVRNYIHSKVAIADDQWATVGSANLDGVSLHRSNHWILAQPASPRGEHMPRATELNALIFNGIDQMPESDVPKELRKKLWAEHLGSDVQLDVKPGQGWLSTWKAKAKEKLDSLTKKPYKRVKSKVLEWNSKTNPEEFLQEHKINTQDFNVRTEVRQFEFETGRWIDE